jgi:hypothetical protein
VTDKVTMCSIFLLLFFCTEYKRNIADYVWVGGFFQYQFLVLGSD